MGKSTEQCPFGITSNTTSIFVNKYKFEFKLSELSYCGAEATQFFIFCSPAGSTNNSESCSRIYEIGGQMPSTGGTYSYTIDVSEYSMFSTMQDISFFDVWEYATERWCLSQFKIYGIPSDGSDEILGYSLDFSPSITVDCPVNDGVYCEGIRITPSLNTGEEFTDGPQPANKLKKCRWNGVRTQYGTVVVSELSDNQSWLDWINSGYNWVYICVGLIGLVCCCIIGCAVMQHIQKKKEAELDELNTDTKRPWHGGNSAFYK